MSKQVTVGDVQIGPKEREYINQVLDSGRLSYGPFSKSFEQLWAKLHDSKFAVFCNSGTGALQISLQALKELHGWSDGDEVLVPSVTFVATANVVLHNRLTPVFVEVDPFTYNIDPARIAAKLTPRTRAIIPVHLAGLPANMTEIAYLSGRHALKIVEDSCETTFASAHGKKVGSWGDTGCFSTYMAHYVVTGVGGLVTTSNPDLAAIVRSLMNHGRDGIYVSIDDDDGLTGDALKEVIQRRFSFDRVGHSFRCTEMEAALGLAQLENWEENVRGRKRVARLYTEGLAPIAGKFGIQLPFEPPGLEHVYMIYPIVVKDPKRKAGLVQHLEERGIETRNLLPLLGQPIYRKMFGDLLEKYPVAKMLDACGFYIGCHQHVDDEAAQHVVDTVAEYFAKV